jgi:hypothetical protein
MAAMGCTHSGTPSLLQTRAGRAASGKRKSLTGPSASLVLQMRWPMVSGTHLFLFARAHTMTKAITFKLTINNEAYSGMLQLPEKFFTGTELDKSLLLKPGDEVGMIFGDEVPVQ